MRGFTIGCICAVVCVACVPDASVLPQVLLYFDTDLPFPERADTLRIDLLDGTGTVRQTRVLHPHKRDWPLSLGLASGPGEEVTLRARLYLEDRIYRLVPSYARGEHDPEDSLEQYTVDRLLRVQIPEMGIERRIALLSGDCLGLKADVSAGEGCVPHCDGGSCEHRPASEGIPVLADGEQPLSAIGSWGPAQTVDCTSEPRTRENGDHWDEVEACVPGGFFYLGDSHLGVTYCLQSGTGQCETVPEHPTQMSPFLMDRFEVSVRAFRAALESGFHPSGSDYGTSLESPLCNFNAPDGEDLPMNCVGFDTARAYCQRLGGDLPTEAQWEFAASGRGEERIFPWGDDEADCEHTAYSRIGPSVASSFGLPASVRATPGSSTECMNSVRGPQDPDCADARPGLDAEWPTDGPQRIGTFCLDRSRDGIFDLAGNVKEWTLDDREVYDSGCWDVQGVLHDPYCEPANPAAANHPLRSGSWAAPAGILANATRWASGIGHGRDLRFNWEFGLRCVRPGQP